jgi:16S rRNA (guanine966-N2)-methyltransferase
MERMRVIAGEFRSRLLESPRGMETRPTTDRLRETLFNVLQPRLAGARFLDLYAGSGANGFEALSRGAEQAVMVESAAPALAAIRKNATTLGLPGRVRVEGVTVSRWLGNTARGLGTVSGFLPFDVVFLDPPYDDAEEYVRTLGLLGDTASGLVARGGIVVAEHRRLRAGKPAKGASPAPIAEQYGRLRRVRLLEQGDAALSFFSLEPAPGEGTPPATQSA